MAPKIRDECSGKASHTHLYIKHIYCSVLYHVSLRTHYVLLGNDHNKYLGSKGVTYVSTLATIRYCKWNLEQKKQLCGHLIQLIQDLDAGIIGSSDVVLPLSTSGTITTPTGVIKGQALEVNGNITLVGQSNAVGGPLDNSLVQANLVGTIVNAPPA
jgi:hypothetical protein